MMMMLSMVEVSPKRRYQVRQVSEPVGLITGSHWPDSPSPPARRPPRDNPRPLSSLCNARTASPELLEEDRPTPLELTRKLSNSAPDLVTASEAERLRAVHLAGREGKRGNRCTQVIGIEDDEELGGEGVYSKLNHFKIGAGVASERRQLEELRCSPESQYSSLNVIQDRSSESSPVNNYSYIDIDIISDKTDGGSPASPQSSQDMSRHNYFVLEIPEDHEEEPNAEKEAARKAEEKGRIQPKVTSIASSIKTTRAGNQINSYAEVNLCKIKPSAKHQKKLQQPIRPQISEYERPVKATETPKRPRGYKPMPVQTRMTEKAGSPLVLDDNIYSQVYLPREEKVVPQQQQRRPFSPLPPLPTSSPCRSFPVSPRTSPPKILPSSPRLSPSPPLISPKLASSQRSSPLSPISKRSPFSPSHNMSPSPSFSYVSSPKTPSPQNSSPSRARHYSSSSASRRDCTPAGSTNFKRGGCYSSQKLKGERIYCNNADHRTIGDDPTHANHVNIIITENGPVLLSNKQSPTGTMATGNSSPKNGGSSVDSLVLEEGHYEVDPNFVNNVVRRS